MTVAELIAELQKFPGDAEVRVDDGRNDTGIEGVDIVVGELGIVYIEIPGL